MQAVYDVLAIVLKNSLIVYRKKKKISFDLSWTMSPVILCGAAKQVVIKFTAEPACNQRCLCRFLLKVSQRSCRILEWMSEHTE